MAAKKRRRKRKKKIEASKKLAYWAAIVASLSAATSYLLSAFGRDPVSEVTGTIFTACVGYLITYAGKSLGEKISRNRHRLDADGNPIKGIPRHPILEDNVIVYSNATILGRVTIGRGAVVGANIWVTEDMEPESKRYNK